MGGSNVLLDFQPLAEEIRRYVDLLREELHRRPHTAPGFEALLITYFLLPTRLRVSGVDLLVTPWRGAPTEATSPWREIPVVGFALRLELALDTVAREGEAAALFLNDSGAVLLRLRGDRLEVKDDLSGRTAHAPFDEVTMAVREFAIRARDLVAPILHDAREHRNHELYSLLARPR